MIMSGKTHRRTGARRGGRRGPTAVLATVLAGALTVGALSSGGSAEAEQVPSAGTDPVHPEILQVYPGDESGPFAERFLAEESGSTAELETPEVGLYPSENIPPPYLNKRWADGDGWFRYELPVAEGTSGPLRLSMITKGEVHLEIEGETVLDTGDSGEGDYTPREFLVDETAWQDGLVDVRFSDADPSDGWGPNLYTLELGRSSTLLERISALEFGSELVWNHGWPDGTGNEFAGSNREVTLPATEADTVPSGELLLHFDHAPEEGKRYILLTSVIGRLVGGWDHVEGTQTVDVGNDQSIEAEVPVGGEKVVDLDVTDQLVAGSNSVRLTAPEGARYDFFALVEVDANATARDGLPMSFGGNEQATSFTKQINDSMYFTKTMLNHANTGFIDSSMINGEFHNTLFIADFGPALLELFRAGEYDRAREAVDYARPDDTGHYQEDVAAGNLVFATMLGLLRVDDYSAESAADYWPRIEGGMQRLTELVDATGLHLVEGTNWETSGGSLGVYASATSYYTLLSAAEAADRLGKSDQADQWRTVADRLGRGMDDNLVWDEDATFLGQPMKKGTWKYGVLPDGSDADDVKAGWHAVGSAKDLHYGLAGDDEAWRTRTDATLDHHRDALWPHWRATGHNKGFGTDYGVLSERGGWPLNSLLHGDRMAEAGKNLHHITFNSDDRNFLPAGKNEANTPGNDADFSEWSPTLIIRETDPLDRGSSANVGNGPGSEDLNLVEYILFLKNARLIAGVDDQLQGDHNLRLVPRLPHNWTTAAVNDHPVVVRDGDDFRTTTLSYDLQRSAAGAAMTVSTATEVAGAEVRLGPFPASTTAATATIDGTTVTSRVEQSGDSAWVWVQTDLGSTERQIAVDVTDPDAVATPDLAAMDGFRTVGDGDWQAADGTASVRVQESTDTWALLDEPAMTDGSVLADVKLSDGNAVGISTRMSADATGGYDLILDAVDGQVKIAKRPYEVVASADLPVKLDRTYRLELRAEGDRLSGWVDGVEVLSATDSDHTEGAAGLFAHSGSAEFRHLQLRR